MIAYAVLADVHLDLNPEIISSFLESIVVHKSVIVRRYEV